MAIPRRWMALVVPPTVLMVAILMSAPLARGQELEADAPHPAHIHSGTCDNLGDIGGRVIDGDLVIGLRELNGSGHHGVAVLEGDDDGTDVKVYLTEEGSGA